MDINLGLLFGAFSLVIIGGLFYFVSEIRRRKKIPIDYYGFFSFGLLWLVVGILLSNWLLFLLGLITSLIGFTNRDKWKKNKRDWKDLSYKEKILLSVALFMIALYIFTAILIKILIKKGLLLN